MAIQWERIAKELGYKDTGHMWQVLYNKHSVGQLAMRFAISANTVRSELRRHDITPKPPGGANNLKLEITPALLERVQTQGVLSLSRELELDETTLYKALKRAGYNARGHREEVGDTETIPPTKPISEEESC
jgi:transposase